MYTDTVPVVPIDAADMRGREWREERSERRYRVEGLSEQSIMAWGEEGEREVKEAIMEEAVEGVKWTGCLTTVVVGFSRWMASSAESTLKAPSSAALCV